MNENFINKEILHNQLFSIKLIASLCSLGFALTGCSSMKEPQPEVKKSPIKYVSEFPDNIIAEEHFAVVDCRIGYPDSCDFSKAETESIIDNPDGTKSIKRGKGEPNLEAIGNRTGPKNRLKIACGYINPNQMTYVDDCANFQISYPGEPDNNSKYKNSINIILNSKPYIIKVKPKSE